jgi:hypothetical protein
MLRRQRAKHGQMAASGWVVTRDPVVKNGDTQTGVP